MKQISGMHYLVVTVLVAVAVGAGIACTDAEEFLESALEPDYVSWVYICQDDHTIQCYKIEYQVAQKVSDLLNGQGCWTVSTENAAHTYSMSEMKAVGVVFDQAGGTERAAGEGSLAYSRYLQLSPLPFIPVLSRNDVSALNLGCGPKAAFYAVAHENSQVLVVETCPFRVADVINVGPNPLQVALSPDGSLLAVSRYDSAVTLVDTTTNRVAANISTPGMFPSGISFSPDGEQIWVTSYIDEDQKLGVIDVAARRVVRTIPTREMFPRSVVLTPDGAQAWVNYYAGNVVSVFDTLTGELIGTLNLGRRAMNGIAFNPTGTRGFIAVDSNILAAYDTATLNQLARITVVSGPVDVHVTADGRSVLVNGEIGAGISVVDARTLKLRATLPVGSRSTGMTAFP